MSHHRHHAERMLHWWRTRCHLLTFPTLSASMVPNDGAHRARSASHSSAQSLSQSNT